MNDQDRTDTFDQVRACDVGFSCLRWWVFAKWWTWYSPRQSCTGSTTCYRAKIESRKKTNRWPNGVCDLFYWTLLIIAGSWRGHAPWKYVEGVRVYLDPLKMSHSFTQNRCWITLQAPQHEGWKTCAKMEGKTNFSWHLKQLMAWPDWPRPPYFTTDLRCWLYLWKITVLRMIEWMNCST